MNSRILVVWLGVLTLTLALSAAAVAQPPEVYGVELSPIAGPWTGDIIEVPPGDLETLWIHIDSAVPGTWYHVDFPPEVGYGVWEGQGSVEVTAWHIQPSMQLEASVWYPLADIMVDGVPSTYIDIWCIVPLFDVGYVNSAPITKHITPEPSSMLALGTGLFGLGGLLLRRRRS